MRSPDSRQAIGSSLAVTAGGRGGACEGRREAGAEAAAGTCRGIAVDVAERADGSTSQSVEVEIVGDGSVATLLFFAATRASHADSCSSLDGSGTVDAATAGLMADNIAACHRVLLCLVRYKNMYRLNRSQSMNCSSNAIKERDVWSMWRTKLSVASNFEASGKYKTGKPHFAVG